MGVNPAGAGMVLVEDEVVTKVVVSVSVSVSVNVNVEVISSFLALVDILFRIGERPTSRCCGHGISELGQRRTGRQGGRASEQCCGRFRRDSRNRVDSDFNCAGKRERGGLSR